MCTWASGTLEGFFLGHNCEGCSTAWLANKRNAALRAILGRHNTHPAGELFTLTGFLYHPASSSHDCFALCALHLLTNSPLLKRNSPDRFVLCICVAFLCMHPIIRLEFCDLLCVVTQSLSPVIKAFCWITFEIGWEDFYWIKAKI